MTKKELQQNIKLAAFDIDGTLLPRGNTRFDSYVINAFESLSKKGIKTALASAREFVTIGDLLKDLKTLDYFIGANGSFIYDIKQDKIIYEKAIKFEDYKIIYETLSNFEACGSILIVDKEYAYKSPNMDTNTWFWQPLSHKVLDNDFDKMDKDHLHIITIACENDDKTLQCVRKINQLIEDYDMDLEITSKWSKGIFVSRKNVNKSSALNWLSDHLNLKLNKNVISFGDSSNDYEMLRDSAYSIAMMRANDWVKSVADDVTQYCEQNGVYNKLLELELINN